MVCVLSLFVTEQHSGCLLRPFVWNVNYLEQSCPLHPGLQWHRFGLMHRPPLRQGEEQTATGNTKTALRLEGGIMLSASTASVHVCVCVSLSLNHHCWRTHRCSNVCLSTRRDTRTCRGPRIGLRLSTAGCRWLRRRGARSHTCVVLECGVNSLIRAA